MPAFRDIIAGLAVGTTLAGGAVALGAITTTTAANAAVVQGAFDDGLGLFGLDGAFAPGLGLAGFNRLLGADRNNDNSVNVNNSFNRQIAPQRLRQRNGN
ncbi:hypothetical protein ACFHYQ_25930 [Sphaerimonospora cavernae]|uniref:Uncharacterized protein n=1 Tax=Sphaerimonospora cavernae TaxID=1740611 RepID=A0ABV6UC23_9ACTN